MWRSKRIRARITWGVLSFGGSCHRNKETQTEIFDFDLGQSQRSSGPFAYQHQHSRPASKRPDTKTKYRQTGAVQAH